MTKTSIGFTGTQRGLTPLQQETLRNYLLGYDPWATDFHHGCCVGADAQAHQLASDKGFYIVGHPCTLHGKQAKCDVDELRDELPPLVRNKEIVAWSDFIIACPFEKEEQLRSGTWMTVRTAQKAGKKVYLIFPDGSSKVLPARA